jgi:glycosyltransferase involved in cell wall biosynthesis
MNVLIIALGHPDNVLSLAYHLSQKVDLTVLFEVPGDNYKEGILNIDISDLDYGLTLNKDKVKKVLPDEINNYIKNRFRIGFIRTFNNKLFKDKWFRNFRTLYSTIKKINHADYDVLHINGRSNFIFYYHFFLNSNKIFWTLHDYKPHSGEGGQFSVKVNKFLVKRKNIKVIQHYKYLKQSIIKDFSLSENKVYQVYSGRFSVYKAFSEKPLISEENYILFFGRISKYKGIDKLLKAYSNISEPSKKLVIAGNGYFWFDIEPYRNNNIIVINRYIETHELINLINHAAFVVLPYTDATHSAVITTAYTFNKPVLASDVGGLRETVKHNKTGLLFNIRDLKEFKDYMEFMSNDDQLLKQFRKNIANGIPKELSWEKITNDYIKLYSESKN